MIANANTVCQNLHKGFRVSVLNECTAFLHALVALEVIEYLLPLDLSATLVQNDDFHKVGV